MLATVLPPRCLAPLSAIALDWSADRLLDFLNRLQNPALVVRSGGLTCYQRTRFGSFRSSHSASTLTLRDEESGLEIDPDCFARICLVQGPDCPPSLEIECVGSGFSLAIWPGMGAADQLLIHNLISSGHGRSLPWESVRQAGASAWLDELDLPVRRFEGRLIFDRDTGTLAVAVRSAAFAISTSFRPEIIDRDGDTLRLSDAAGHHVLHIRADHSPAPFTPECARHHSVP